MVCACWLHSSFLELSDPPAQEEKKDTGNNDLSSVVRLGLRQLDGCSKGKAIDLFEEEFNIEIEMSACHARPRQNESRVQQQQQQGSLTRQEVVGL